MVIGLGDPVRGSHGPRCAIGAWLLANPQDADEMRGYLNDARRTGRSLVTDLAAVGIDFPLQTVQRHRRKECRCAATGIA